MSDELVERLRSDWFGYDVSLRAIDAMEEAADRIEQLERELSISRMAQVVMDNGAEALTAERDRLRATLEDIADHDTGATAGLAYTAKIALKGETP